MLRPTRYRPETTGGSGECPLSQFGCGDSFQKIVVVDGVQPFYTDESGVSFVGLMDFMLNREILA